MPRLLAIDYGKKRCGLAVSDPMQMIATPLETVETKDLWDFLKNYLRNESVELIVVGLPRQMDNTPSECEKYIMPFIERFRKEYPHIPLDRYDERFTSIMAFQTMIDAGLKKKQRQDKALVDRTSAVIILQSYMQSRTKSL